MGLQADCAGFLDVQLIYFKTGVMFIFSSFLQILFLTALTTQTLSVFLKVGCFQVILLFCIRISWQERDVHIAKSRIMRNSDEESLVIDQIASKNPTAVTPFRAFKLTVVSNKCDSDTSARSTSPFVRNRQYSFCIRVFGWNKTVYLTVCFY